LVAHKIYQRDLKLMVWKQGFLFFETKAKIYEVYASSKEDAKWEY
jgi:hypothetical protein